jgi:hypothetical protein
MRAAAALAASLVAALLVVWPGPARHIVELPPGTVELRSPIVVAAGTELRGAPAGTVLHMAGAFAGSAAVIVGGDDVTLQDFAVDGNRAAIEVRAELPPSNIPFAGYTRANGVLAEGVARLAIQNVRFRNIAGFAVLASRARRVSIEAVEIADSGSRDAAGRNNSTGGILLEEGAADFRVAHCRLRRVRGNGVWTHSLYTSPRNARGTIEANVFEEIGRDAIQVGHAVGVRVEDNWGSRIGFPFEDVDIEHVAVPVAIDTAGDVERSRYAGNSFQDLDGKCIDLDGFHDGEVRGNSCVNLQPPEAYRYGNYGIVMNNSNPDMRSRNILVAENTIVGAHFGGIFVIGTGHRIVRNRLLDLNRAHCNQEAARFGCYYAPGEPDMLRAGIYLGRGAARPAPARGNVVEDNEITGFGMETRCIAPAPGVAAGWNTIRGNRCGPETTRRTR